MENTCKSRDKMVREGHDDMLGEGYEEGMHIVHKMEEKTRNLEAILSRNTSITHYQFKALNDCVIKLTTKLISTVVQIEHLIGKSTIQET